MRDFHVPVTVTCKVQAKDWQGAESMALVVVDQAMGNLDFNVDPGDGVEDYEVWTDHATAASRAWRGGVT
jgi:hypothetical protein